MSTNKNKKKGGLQAWMDSKTGQMFLNYAYSWGAAVVILGALFKLTHIKGADLMLFIGMGTEVVVFFLSGFERPWSDDGKPEEEPEMQAALAPNYQGVPMPAYPQESMEPVESMESQDVPESQEPSDTGESPAVQAGQLANAIAGVAVPQVQGMTPEMQEATTNYVNQLNELTETLKLVAEQSARLTRDSEEMETMNRTLTGINRFYELQLRSVSQQSTTIDQVKEQTEHLAEQLEELNAVYARMVEALKTKL